MGVSGIGVAAGCARPVVDAGCVPLGAKPYLPSALLLQFLPPRWHPVGGRAGAGECGAAGCHRRRLCGAARAPLGEPVHQRCVARCTQLYHPPPAAAPPRRSPQVFTRERKAKADRKRMLRLSAVLGVVTLLLLAANAGLTWGGA